MDLTKPCHCSSGLYVAIFMYLLFCRQTGSSLGHYPLTPNVVIQNSGDNKTEEDVIRRAQRGREHALEDDDTKV